MGEKPARVFQNIAIFTKHWLNKRCHIKLHLFGGFSATQIKHESGPSLSYALRAHTTINQYGIKLLFPSFAGEVQSRTSSREINKLCTIKQKIIRMPTTTINLHDLTLRHTHPISSRRRRAAVRFSKTYTKRHLLSPSMLLLPCCFYWCFTSSPTGRLYLHSTLHHPPLDISASHPIASHRPQSQVLSLALRLIITSI